MSSNNINNSNSKGRPSSPPSSSHNSNSNSNSNSNCNSNSNSNSNATPNTNRSQAPSLSFTPKRAFSLANLFTMDAIFPLILLIMSMLLYKHALLGAFVWDDRAAILNNNDVVGSASIWEILEHDFWGQDIHASDSHKSFRPITTLSYRLNFLFSGTDGWSYHLTNNFIYGLVVVCTYYFILEVTGIKSIAQLTSILFLVHPVHIEAVSILVGRADSLCAFFYLLGLICYCKCIRYDKKPDYSFNSFSNSYYFYLSSSIALALFASLSKEVGATAFVYYGFIDFIYRLDEEFKSEKKNILRNKEDYKSNDYFDMYKVMKIVKQAVLYYLPINSIPTAVSNSASFSSLSTSTASSPQSSSSVPTNYNSFSSISTNSKRNNNKFSRGCHRAIIIFVTVFIFSIWRLRVNGIHTLYKWTLLENHISLLPNRVDRILSYGQSHFWYIFKMFYPLYLSFDYGYYCIPTISSIADIRNFLPIATYLWLIRLVVNGLRRCLSDIPTAMSATTATTATTSHGSSATNTELLDLFVVVERPIDECAPLDPKHELRMPPVDHNRAMLLVFGTIVIPLFPASNIVFPVGTTLAERLMLLPSLGVCLYVAIIISHDLFPMWYYLKNVVDEFTWGWRQPPSPSSPHVPSSQSSRRNSSSSSGGGGGPLVSPVKQKQTPQAKPLQAKSPVNDGSNKSVSFGNSSSSSNSNSNSNKGGILKSSPKQDPTSASPSVLSASTPSPTPTPTSSSSSISIVSPHNSNSNNKSNSIANSSRSFLNSNLFSRLFPIKVLILVALSPLIIMLTRITAARIIDWDNELHIYRSALAVCPNNIKALTNFAALAVNSPNQSEREVAALSAEFASKIYTNHLSSHNNAALAYQRIQQYVKSARYYSYSLIQSPNDGKMRSQYATTLWNMALTNPSNSNYFRTMALRELSRAINEAGFQTVNVFHSRGSLYIELNDYYAALTDFHFAMYLYVSYLNYYFSVNVAVEGTLLLAKLNQALGILDESMRQFHSADPRNFFNKGGLYRNSIAWLPQDDPVDIARTLNQISNCYATLGDKNRAYSILSIALEIDPSQIASYVNIGSVLRQLNLLEDAVAYLLRGLIISSGMTLKSNETTGEFINMLLQDRDIKSTLKSVPISLLNNLGLVLLDFTGDNMMNAKLAAAILQIAYDRDCESSLSKQDNDDGGGGGVDSMRILSEGDDPRKTNNMILKNVERAKAEVKRLSQL